MQPVTDPLEILDLLDRFGVLGLLVVILYGGVRGWWVFGWVYQDKLRQAEEWKRLALHGTAVIERAVKSWGRRVSGGD